MNLKKIEMITSKLEKYANLTYETQLCLEHLIEYVKACEENNKHYEYSPGYLYKSFHIDDVIAKGNNLLVNFDTEEDEGLKLIDEVYDMLYDN